MGRQGALHELQSLSGQLLLPSEKSLQKGEGLVFSFVEGITKCKSFCWQTKSPAKNLWLIRKSLFFSPQDLHAHSSSRNNKCPKATSYNLFAPTFQPSTRSGCRIQ